MKYISLFILFFMAVSTVSIAGSSKLLESQEARYQADAGKKRINDVYEIAQLLEECKEKQGQYPFVGILEGMAKQAGKPVPLAILLAQPDQNWAHKPFPFTMDIFKQSAKPLIQELEKCLERDISLPIDPQNRAYHAPNTYIVMFTSDGSYVVIAFLYKARDYTSRLAEYVNAFAVSSNIGEQAQKILNDMRIKPKIFTEITQDEIDKAKIDGKKIDKMFSNWAKIRVNE